MGWSGGQRRTTLRRIAGLLFALLCLYLAFRGVDREELLRLVSTASAPLLVAAVALSLLTIAVKCTKLGILLHAVCPFQYRVLLSAELVSIIVDIAFPLRLQELVKAYIIGRGERIPASFVLGAEMVEKCVELVALLSVLFLLSILHPLPEAVTLGVRIAAAASIAAFLLLVVIVARPQLHSRLIGRIERIRLPGMQRLHRLLDNVLRGIREAAVRPRMLGGVLGVTAIEWLLLAATLWVSARAVGVALTMPQLLGVIAFNMIAFAVPTSTSGSVGIYELAGTATLVLVFGFTHEKALAVTLALHAVMVGSGILGGLAGLHMAHLSLARIRREAAREEVMRNT